MNVFRLFPFPAVPVGRAVGSESPSWGGDRSITTLYRGSTCPQGGDLPDGGMSLQCKILAKNAAPSSYHRFACKFALSGW